MSQIEIKCMPKNQLDENKGEILEFIYISGLFPY